MLPLDAEEKTRRDLLVVWAVLAGIVGGPMLSQATVEVGIIGGACLRAILGRILQVAQHHDREMEAWAHLLRQARARNPLRALALL